jgi:hypothetical protein
MDVICSFETTVNYYQDIRWHIMAFSHMEVQVYSSWYSSAGLSYIFIKEERDSSELLIITEEDK